MGDVLGIIWIYATEWTNDEERKETGWKGSLSVVGKIEAHSSQVCGFAWSSDGSYFASGGNDNKVNVFLEADFLKDAA